MDKARVGFIGVGYMGRGMAGCLMRAGHPLQVRGNRNREPVDALVAEGAVEAASPRAMAETCDVIHLCLSNSPQVEAVIRADDGILAAARPGVTVIDTTTADPTSTAALAAEMEAAGMTLVDAPLGRTPKEAAEGTLDAMVGASPEDFERVRPIIETWAGTITHVGPVGSGHRMKLVMNFVSMGYAALYSEALVTGAKAGLSPDVIRRVLEGSRMANGFMETFMRGAIGGEPDVHPFTIRNARKDVRYAANMAADAGVANLLGAAILQSFTMAEAQGRGDGYVPSLAEFVAGVNGLDLA
jgi:3-hydroxyisobutyrate dehydrogenase-like beta-hydroxyacid dehydrogenase